MEGPRSSHHPAQTRRLTGTHWSGPVITLCQVSWSLLSWLLYVWTAEFSFCDCFISEQLIVTLLIAIYLTWWSLLSWLLYIWSPVLYSCDCYHQHNTLANPHWIRGRKLEHKRYIIFTRQMKHSWKIMMILRTMMPKFI